MLNRKLLELEMFQYGDNQASLSKAMNVAPNTLMWKLQGKYDFKQKEIKFIADRYKLDIRQVSEIFFSEGV
jgi:hypothetical protein